MTRDEFLDHYENHHSKLGQKIDLRDINEKIALDAQPAEPIAVAGADAAAAQAIGTQQDPSNAAP